MIFSVTFVYYRPSVLGALQYVFVPELMSMPLVPTSHEGL